MVPPPSNGFNHRALQERPESHPCLQPTSNPCGLRGGWGLKAGTQCLERGPERQALSTDPGRVFFLLPPLSCRLGSCCLCTCCSSQSCSRLSCTASVSRRWELETASCAHCILPVHTLHPLTAHCILPVHTLHPPQHAHCTLTGAGPQQRMVLHSPHAGRAPLHPMCSAPFQEGWGGLWGLQGWKPQLWGSAPCASPRRAILRRLASYHGILIWLVEFFKQCELAKCFAYFILMSNIYQTESTINQIRSFCNPERFPFALISPSASPSPPTTAPSGYT